MDPTKTFNLLIVRKSLYIYVSIVMSTGNGIQSTMKRFTDE